MEIVPNKGYYMGVKNMVRALAREKEEVAPNQSESIVKSIFQGTPFPYTLLSACIRRIKAEAGTKYAVSITRAAIIKAYLNRLNHNEIKTMLDKENSNLGYLCGRLFAVMDELQYAVNQQDSIRSGYMSAASSTPSAVFPTVLKLSNNHYLKLAKDKKGLANYFDSQKKEIMAMMQDFPVTLDLSDQGRFFLGYYHQKNYRKEQENED